MSPRLAAAALAFGLAAACALNPPEDDAASADAAEDEEAEPTGPLRVGDRAPDFVLLDVEGRGVRLADLRGRIVVLEWFDPSCVFVESSHEDGTLDRLTRELPEQGVAWLAINSTGPGKPSASREENRRFALEHELGHPILLDPNGRVGAQYGATRAPELFVIDEEGVLAYRGPADDGPFGKVKGGAPPTSYVEETIAELRDGRPPRRRRAKLYGCGIKYARP